MHTTTTAPAPALPGGRKAQTKLLKEQVKQVKQEQDNIQWDEILAAFEAGEMTWDDLSRMQKFQMPIIYQGKCKAAQRRQALAELASPGSHKRARSHLSDLPRHEPGATGKDPYEKDLASRCSFGCS